MASPKASRLFFILVGFERMESYLEFPKVKIVMGDADPASDGSGIGQIICLTNRKVKQPHPGKMTPMGDHRDRRTLEVVQNNI